MKEQQCNRLSYDPLSFHVEQEMIPKIYLLQVLLTQNASERQDLLNKVVNLVTIVKA